MKQSGILLVFCVFYLGLTLLLVVFGPWDWQFRNPTFVYGYYFSSLLVFSIGFYLGSKSVSRFEKKVDVLDPKIFWDCCKIGAPVILMALIFRTEINFSNLLEQISNPGSSYNYIDRAVPAYEYLRYILSYFWISLPMIFMVYFKNLSRWGRAFGLFLIFCISLVSLTNGTTKTLADVCFALFVGFLLIKVRAGGAIILNAKTVLLGLILAIGALTFFTTTVAQREGSGLLAGLWFNGVGHITIKDSWSLDSPVALAIAAYTRYMGQSFYALDLLVDAEYNWSYFAGNSIFLSRQLEVLFGFSDSITNSSTWALEQQFMYGRLEKWHGFHVWWASDVGLAGALFLTAILAFVLARYWILCTLNPTHFRITCFYLAILGTAYLPANNQLFQDGELFFAVIVCLCIGFLKWCNKIRKF